MAGYFSSPADLRRKHPEGRGKGPSSWLVSNRRGAVPLASAPAYTPRDRARGGGVRPAPEEPVPGQPADQLRPRQESHALDEVKLRHLGWRRAVNGVRRLVGNEFLDTLAAINPQPWQDTETSVGHREPRCN
jgi:hypothetical protein